MYHLLLATLLCTLPLRGVSAETTTTSCTYTAHATAPGGGACDVDGYLTAPAPIASPTGIYGFADCESACDKKAGCKSYADDRGSPQGHCVLFGKTLEQQGFVRNEKSERTYYDKGCNTINCYVASYNPKAPFYMLASGSGTRADGKYAVVASEEGAKIEFTATSKANASTFLLLSNSELKHVADGRIADVPEPLVYDPQPIEFTSNVDPYFAQKPRPAVHCELYVSTNSTMIVSCQSHSEFTMYLQNSALHLLPFNETCTPPNANGEGSCVIITRVEA